jgi:hypothetical protein
MTIRQSDLLLFVASFGFLVAALAAAQSPAAQDWTALAEIGQVDVLTTDADGDARETVIWFAVHAGVPYIRTSGGSKWGDNIERDPNMVLRVEGQEYALRATQVSDAALLEAVHATFREKYGWFDAVAGVVRGSSPRIMQLSARVPDAPQ